MTQDPQLTRRSVVTAAAWAAPAVAIAVAAPAASASGDPARSIILFTDAPPPVPAGSPTPFPIDWRLVQANGQPARNVQMTVTLFDGATFASDGSTVRVYLSDAEGNITIAAGEIIVGLRDAEFVGSIASGATAGAVLQVS